MLTNKIALATSLSLSLGLAGCGGGGGSQETGETEKKVIVANRAPVIAVTDFSSQEDVTLTSTITATDADQDALTFSLINSTQHGIVTLKTSGEFTYQPDPDFHGEDSFSVEVSDGEDKVNADITLVVAPVNDTPRVANVTTFTRASQAITFALPASDVDGDTLTFQLSVQPNKGSAALNSDNTLTYTPNASEQGIDTL